MKKTILAILLCGVMLLGVTGCETTNDFEIGNVSNIEINNDKDVKNNLSTCPCCTRNSKNSVGVVSGFHLSKDSATALLSQNS